MIVKKQLLFFSKMPDFFLVKNFLAKKYKILGLKIHILGKFNDKIKFLSTHDFLCGKIATFCPRVTTTGLEKLRFFKKNFNVSGFILSLLRFLGVVGF